MIRTFAELGISFPLFEAPSDQATEYLGVSDCSLCGKSEQHCFELGVGCAVMVACPQCETVNGLAATDRENQACRQCQTVVQFPKVSDEISVCYECLRAGMVAITKDTELGMISWEQAFEGVTHGIPALNRQDFEMVPKEDGWVGARLPQEMMFELMRTPTYRSIQGDQWQFCCQRPAVALGQWEQDDFLQCAPDGNCERLLQEIIGERIQGLWQALQDGSVNVYVFRCESCGRHKGHWDAD